MLLPVDHDNELRVQEHGTLSSTTPTLTGHRTLADSSCFDGEFSPWKKAQHRLS
jgi:hypothetical protein